ncbi:disease resistance protein [Dorcoceras hygrometricum]|uniref:Disease resistance protein n=1 Tax=Dorcoceras hygrometricum TaxID=472368 RepID=A0A2Z7CI34_9LAMI|nr:disease resistance protein [Dorcoceras hygrometricum]
MGIDQLKFQSVQLGYLKILQLGNTDPNNKSRKRKYECINRENHQSVIFRLVSHHSSVVFRHNQSVGHHYDDSVGPFRHDTSVCRSQRGSILAAQLVPSILKFYLDRSYSVTEIPAYSTSFLHWSRPTQQGLPRSSNPEANTNRRLLYSAVARTHKSAAPSRFSSNVNSSHLTGINRKRNSRRAQRHQSRSKPRRKSMTINRIRLRMNSIYRGFRRRR